MTDVLQLKGLRKDFGELQIIRGVDLTIREHERHAVIGPNGAGKSTLFHLISGLHVPSEGEILLKGAPIQGLKPHLINRRGLARSFQITNIFPRLSIFENVRIGVMAKRGLRFTLWRRVARLKEINGEAEALLDLVRLTRQRDRLAGDLAYSDQRALEIAMALSTGADVILLDEPTAGMSTDETAYMVDLIRRTTVGKTLLIVEHDMSVVFSLCDRISVLVYGEIIASDGPEAIRADAAVQTAYLGDVDMAGAGAAA
jgi:branched-chain amino acid transport system ATP-binding protein